MSEFKNKYGPWAYIAGASEGIGEAFSHQIAAHGVNLVMVARRQEPLERTAEVIRSKHGVEVRTHSLDLAASDLLVRVKQLTQSLEIGLLVYNAAASKIGPFLETSVEDHMLEVAVNVTGPLRLTHHFGGQMVKRGRGGIILMTSMSALQGTAIVANYAATKAYDTVLAEGLWSEFRREGVDVLACMAGATATPGYLRETKKPPTDAIGKPMTADDVVKDALADLGSKPRSVPGRRNEALAFVLTRIIGKEKAIRTVSKETTKLYGKR